MEIPRTEPLVSPPAPVGELEVPDPFLREPEDDDSAEESSASASEGVQGEDLPPSPAPAAEEITLAPPPVSAPPTPRSPNLNKSIPPTPQPASEEDDDDEDEEEVPELYLPGLTLPTMFLPIPNTDPLSTLLTKYIPPEKRPPRDLTGDYSRAGGELHPLIMTNSWRAIARQARDRIVEADPEDVPYILSLWYLRVSSLARMRLFNQTAAECTNLFGVLHAVAPPAARAHLLARVLPFELDVLHARLKYWAGDHLGYLDALAALLGRCREGARAGPGDAAMRAMWAERGARVGLIIASQLVEMRDYTAAATILEPLCRQPGNLSPPALHSAVARIYLQGGCLALAAPHLAAAAAASASSSSPSSSSPGADSAQIRMNAALLAAAEGDWARAAKELRDALEADPEDLGAANNLAVVLLNTGRVREAVQVLESGLHASPAAIVSAEPYLFNLSTLYELRSAAGADKKRELLIEVAKWAGDGLRTTCLKLPTT
ncbi:hypothetical protein C8Q78DRAFT_963869 [Trametes maxima]|nr:hypothetical protein C8Q78DRAFT_963869 [Trametes maxima]